MLCGAIWICTVFIMNIHQGVAMRSDVKFLRDGTSGLREVVEQLGTGTLSKSAQDELKRKPNVILVDQTLVTDDLHSQMSGVMALEARSMWRNDSRQTRNTLINTHRIEKICHVRARGEMAVSKSHQNDLSADRAYTFMPNYLSPRRHRSTLSAGGQPPKSTYYCTHRTEYMYVQ